MCVCLPVQDYKQQETRPAFCVVLKACHAFDKKLSFQIFEICQDRPLTENAASCRGRSEQIPQCAPTPPTPVSPLRGTQTHSFPKAVIKVRRGSGPGVPLNELLCGTPRAWAHKQPHESPRPTSKLPKTSPQAHCPHALSRTCEPFYGLQKNM